MKLVLKDFQEEATDQLVRELHNAAREAQNGRPQAVCLASPTGSGKTIIATAAMERLLEGDTSTPPMDDVTFLWLSDQPELNEQTRRKIEGFSSLLGADDLLDIDANFDAPILDAETVYFINIQRLGEDKLLVQHGDDRTYTFWETVNNTIKERGGRFLLLVDEAHRGMEEDTAQRERAASIVQKFIKGVPAELTRVPVVAGISATPERFQRLIEGTDRVFRPVVVGADEVKKSGLLKESVTVSHPTDEEQPDITLLRAAAREWKSFRNQWRDYSSRHLSETVRPIFVVQVTDGTGSRISNTNLEEAIRAIEEEIGPMSDRQFAHCFQERRSLEIGSYSVRYLSPPDIQEDEDVIVVFFKTALNTGWDCPRAEVIMSFRRAKDATSIAQLVGRMVRTPLARHVEANEVLNTVGLYLPYYDEENLEAIITLLTQPDSDFVPPTTVQPGEDRITLHRRSDSDKYFDLLERIPNYEIPRRRSPSQVHRYLKLCRRLAYDGIDENALDVARRGLQEELLQIRNHVATEEDWEEHLEEEMEITLRSVDWSLKQEKIQSEAETTLELSSEDLERLFNWADRRIGREGLHRAFWRRRTQEADCSPRRAKMELVALARRGSVRDRLEDCARTHTQELLRSYRTEIRELDDSRRSGYREIQGLVSEPELTDLTYPDVVTWLKSDSKWEKHLYVDDNGSFPASFNAWEERVLKKEIDRDEVVTWLRNPDRKNWSLTIPYELGGEVKPFYPDFLIIREGDGGPLVDLLEPHTADFADAPAKAAALARYADKHAPAFGRIELIVVEGDRIRRLDLAEEKTRSRVRGVTTSEHLKQLFEG